MNNDKKPKNLLNQATTQIFKEQEDIENLLLKKKEQEDKKLKSLQEQINQLKKENQKLVQEKKQPVKKIKQSTSVYFCDICQTSKNSKIDGEVYLIKISIRPNVISSVCPACRPNVIMMPDDD